MSIGKQIVGLQRVIILPYAGVTLAGRSGTQSIVLEAVTTASLTIEQQVQKNVDGIGSTHDVALSVANYSFSATISEFPIGIWRELGATLTQTTATTYTPIVTPLSGNSPTTGFIAVSLVTNATAPEYTPRYDAGVDTLLVIAENSPTATGSQLTVSIFGVIGSTVLPSGATYPTAGGTGATALSVVQDGKYKIWEGTVAPGALGQPFTVDVALPQRGSRLGGTPDRAVRISIERNVRPTLGTSFIYAIPLHQRGGGYTADLGAQGAQARDVTVIASAVSDKIAVVFGIVVPRAKLRQTGDQTLTQKEYMRVEIGGDTVLTQTGAANGLGSSAIFSMSRREI